MGTTVHSQKATNITALSGDLWLVLFIVCTVSNEKSFASNVLLLLFLSFNPTLKLLFQHKP
jgi:hypothetical protein